MTTYSVHHTHTPNPVLAFIVYFSSFSGPLALSDTVCMCGGHREGMLWDRNALPQKVLGEGRLQSLS